MYKMKPASSVLMVFLTLHVADVVDVEPKNSTISFVDTSGKLEG